MGNGEPHYISHNLNLARVAELADALDLGSSGQPMGVQLPPLAPSRINPHEPYLTKGNDMTERKGG